MWILVLQHYRNQDCFLKKNFSLFKVFDLLVCCSINIFYCKQTYFPCSTMVTSYKDLLPNISCCCSNRSWNIFRFGLQRNLSHTPYIQYSAVYLRVFNMASWIVHLLFNIMIAYYQSKCYCCTVLWYWSPLFRRYLIINRKAKMCTCPCMCHYYDAYMIV